MKQNALIRNAITFIAVATLGLAVTSVHANNAPVNLFGIDVSSYQGSINWSNVYANGARFAFAKATEGTTSTDADFVVNMKHGKKNGLQMGAYHFAYPASSCPSTQANHFWSVAGAYILADGESLMPAVDFEEFTGIACGEGNYTTWFNDYLVDLKAKTPLFLRGEIIVSPCNSCYLTSGITLGPWILNQNGQSLYTGNPWSTCCTCNPWDSTHVCNSNAWDYWGAATGSIGGVQGSCDFDAYNGTLAELKSWQGV
jgi:lysozyme